MGRVESLAALPSPHLTSASFKKSMSKLSEVYQTEALPERKFPMGPNKPLVLIICRDGDSDAPPLSARGRHRPTFEGWEIHTSHFWVFLHRIY